MTLYCYYCLLLLFSCFEIDIHKQVMYGLSTISREYYEKYFYSLFHVVPPTGCQWLVPLDTGPHALMDNPSLLIAQLNARIAIVHLQQFIISRNIVHKPHFGLELN